MTTHWDEEPKIFMKILMLTTKFPAPGESQWLTSELANELADLGHDIRVLNVEWGRRGKPFTHSKGQLSLLYRFSIDLPFIGQFGLALKWVLSSIVLLPDLIRCFFLSRRYDLLLCFSPCSALYLAIPFAKLISKDQLLIYWDFFPLHNSEISKGIPSWGAPLLKAVETKLVHQFSRVGCMSPANVKFFSEYFGIKENQEIGIIPVWSSFLNVGVVDKNAIRQQYGLGAGKILIIFGGQLVDGRGLDTVINATAHAREKDSRLQLVVCGAGHLAALVREYASADPDGFVYLGPLARHDYLNLLSVADIGVVATVAGVSCPTFPSKSLDYMAASLPIAACVEKASDFGEIIENAGAGRWCNAGDENALATIFLEFSADNELRRRCGDAGHEYLSVNHDLKLVVKKVLGEKSV